MARSLKSKFSVPSWWLPGIDPLRAFVRDIAEGRLVLKPDKLAEYDGKAADVVSLIAWIRCQHS